MVIKYDEVTPLACEVGNVAKDLYFLAVGSGVSTRFSGASPKRLA
jgi:hypothetical protein